MEKCDMARSTRLLNQACLDKADGGWGPGEGAAQHAGHPRLKHATHLQSGMVNYQTIFMSLQTVDADLARVLPVMLATKLLPEMEAADGAALDAHAAEAGSGSAEAQYDALLVGGLCVEWTDLGLRRGLPGAGTVLAVSSTHIQGSAAGPHGSACM